MVATGLNAFTQGVFIEQYVFCVDDDEVVIALGNHVDDQRGGQGVQQAQLGRCVGCCFGQQVRMDHF